MSASHPAAEADFAALVFDVAQAIEHTMPQWRVRLGEAAARWRAEGVQTAVLERALALPDDPGVESLLGTFAAAVARLRALERVAAATDPQLAGAPCFRDPERVREAGALVARARTTAAPTRLVRPDAERWVLDWPSVDALLAEDAG